MGYPIFSKYLIMKRECLFLMLLSLPMFAHAQKYDNNWLMGYSQPSSDKVFGISALNFTKGYPIISRDSLWSIKYAFGRNSVILSDSSGKFLFASNGIDIRNSKAQIIPNGDSLNYLGDGFVWNYNKSGGYGAYLDPANFLAIPYPTKHGQFILFHTSYDDDLNKPKDFRYYIPSFTVVDMTDSDKVGNVPIKNKPYLPDTLFRISSNDATLHANGRDWWLLMEQPEFVYTTLISNAGVQFKEKQLIDTLLAPVKGRGPSFFSSDGTRYCIVNGSISTNKKGNISYFDFDRCSGKLSNPRNLPLPEVDFMGGGSISQDNHYLLVNSIQYIIQYDMQAPDIVASGDTIAVYDGYCCIPAGTPFFLPWSLAPDNKLYWTTWSSNGALHRCDRPTLPGLALNFRQHSIALPTYNDGTTLSYPNYRLGPLKGSPCDTLKMATPDGFDRADHSYEVPLTTGVPLPADHPAYIRQSSPTAVDGYLEGITIPDRDLLWYKMKNK
jgi:hypothetical protein